MNMQQLRRLYSNDNEVKQDSVKTIFADCIQFIKENNIAIEGLVLPENYSKTNLEILRTLFTIFLEFEDSEFFTPEIYDAIYKILCKMTKKLPKNMLDEKSQIEDPISSDVIPLKRLVILSNGYYCDIESLVQIINNKHANFDPQTTKPYNSRDLKKIIQCSEKNQIPITPSAKNMLIKFLHRPQNINQWLEQIRIDRNPVEYMENIAAQNIQNINHRTNKRVALLSNLALGFGVGSWITLGFEIVCAIISTYFMTMVGFCCTLGLIGLHSASKLTSYIINKNANQLIQKHQHWLHEAQNNLEIPNDNPYRNLPSRIHVQPFPPIFNNKETLLQKQAERISLSIANYNQFIEPPKIEVPEVKAEVIAEEKPQNAPEKLHTVESVRAARLKFFKEAAERPANEIALLYVVRGTEPMTRFPN
jgi:hypothetical protein